MITEDSKEEFKIQPVSEIAQNEPWKGNQNACHFTAEMAGQTSRIMAEPSMCQEGRSVDTEPTCSI